MRLPVYVHIRLINKKLFPRIVGDGTYVQLGINFCLHHLWFPFKMTLHCLTCTTFVPGAPQSDGVIPLCTPYDKFVGNRPKYGVVKVP